MTTTTYDPSCATCYSRRQMPPDHPEDWGPHPEHEDRRPAVAYKLQEVTVDGAPILPARYPSFEAAILAGRAHGADLLARFPDVGDHLLRIDVIWAGRGYREDRTTAWIAPRDHARRLAR